MRDISRTTRRLQPFLPLLILALAALVTLALIKTRSAPQAQDAAIKRWNVTRQTLAPVTAAPELELYGQFEAPQLTRLSSALNADVIAILVQEGETVIAGAPLLQLDRREAALLQRQRQAERDAIDARIDAEHNRHRSDQRSLALELEVLALNQERVARAERLQARSLLSQEQLDNTRLTTRQQALAIRARRQAIADHPHRLAQLQAERDRIQALLEQAELDLSRTALTAPFNARIVSIDTAVGNRTRLGDPLLTLYDVDRLQLRAQIPAALLPVVRQALHAAGQPLKADATLDGQPLTLQLQRLSARINPGQAGMDALFALSGDTTPPTPGRTLSLRLQLPPQPGLFALPPDALYGQDRVYRLADDDRLEAVEVQLVGQRYLADGREQVLLQGPSLQPGDRIITTQLPNAIGGLPVNVVD
ncbi:efflux RND transporter periplasmic adaptor subunit [Marinobacterium weihaiense]|uniref:HlyD family efflux transporter periplasmic adaptor subunit n=1 Tax=Marinobacterium weihaiense TaxID=2851016 RepID=A0ABS6M8K2_9GAMM|nr:HlyD family efflux transporter periplasmic adaptor subunit [Marinobacterium weihaiense]MBV0932617.1 HlyD family efflux transporter periplasmic adaptor subunit [Marinobacterium weihaiense]